MSVFSLILVLQNKTSKIINGKANISKKSQKITPFGGNFKWETLFPSCVPEKKGLQGVNPASPILSGINRLWFYAG